MATCTKKKFDKIGAMLLVAGVKSGVKNSNRQERRWYWCSECKAYHVTSKGRFRRSG